MATIVAAAGGGNWTAGGTWVGGVAPTNADDAQIPATAGNITIDTGATCRSADFSTYTGTLTHNAGVTWSIGGAAAGLSNIALKLVAGMTYTINNATTSAINFVTQSTTAQTVTWAGKVPGNVTFNSGTNTGAWQLQDGYTATATTLTFSRGVLDVNGQTLSVGGITSNSGNTRTLTLGAASLTVALGASAWNTGTVTGLTVTANSATLTLAGGGATFTSGTFDFNGMSIAWTGAGSGIGPSGNCTFKNITRTGTAVVGDSFFLTGNLTATGTITITGNSLVNRMFVLTVSPGSAVTLSAATGVTLTNVDFSDITAAGTSSPFTGTSLGDLGGNTSITFDAPATQFWVGNAGNWSDSAGHWASSSGGAAGTGRIPLPQDTAKFDANSFTANTQTVTLNMPRLAGVDCTGQNNTAITFSTTATWYGGIVFSGNETIANGNAVTLSGRGAFNLTNLKVAGSATVNITVNAFGGTYTLQGANVTSVGDWMLTRGTFDLNGFTLGCSRFVSNSGATRTLTFGTGTINLTSTTAGAVWIAASAAFTLNATSGTIAITSTSANTRSFTGAGLSYGTLTYTVAGSTGQLTMSDGNTFVNINFSDVTNARTLAFTIGTTTTITGTFNVNGTAGKLMSIVSTTAGTAATLSKASGIVSCDFLSVKDSTATGGAAWYAGANSTDVSGNSGWIFRSIQVLSPGAIGSDEAFGTALVTLYLVPTGIASGEATGSPVVTAGAVVVSPTGIATGEAFGTATVGTVGSALSPTGIASAEAFGTALVTLYLVPTGIASAEAFGTAVITTGGVVVSPLGIATGEAVGVHTVTTGAVVVTPTGIATAEALGAATVTRGAVFVSPTGIASAEACGTAVITTGGVVVSPLGITTGEALGVPVVAHLQAIVVTGIAGAEAFGTAVLSMGVALDVGGRTNLALLDDGRRLLRLLDDGRRSLRLLSD